MSTENADMATGATAEEIDEAFDRGEDMRKYFDFEHGELRQPDVVKEVRTYRKVNVDFAPGCGAGFRGGAQVGGPSRPRCPYTRGRMQRQRRHHG